MPRDDDDRPLGISARQAKLAGSLGDGRRVALDAPEPNRAVFSDEQVAATCARVFSWVSEGREPPAREPEDGWVAVAMQLRSMFASDVEPPGLLPDQLADVVRNVFARATGGTTFAPIATIPPPEYACWRAAALHAYNCVVADPEGLRKTPLADRERLIVAQARQAIGA